MGGGGGGGGGANLGFGKKEGGGSSITPCVAQKCKGAIRYSPPKYSPGPEGRQEERG